MTEKRYEWCADGIDIWDNQKQERIDYDFPVLLNEQHDRIRYLEKRNQNIINHVKTSMENERTHIGYNVLKQLWDAIQ